MIRKEILKSKIQEKKDSYQRLTDKLKRIAKQRENETRVEETMRMDDIIAGIEKDRDALAEEMAQLEHELNALEASTAPPAAETAAPAASKPAGPIEIFYSYAHEDEALRDKLNTHLKILERQGIIRSWHDRDISAGSEWAGQIDEHLESADIVLLLVSADFIASDYCWDIELKRAMERHEAGQARVIPIILRTTDWSGAPFGKLQALPKDARPVMSWNDKDEAFDNIARSIRRVAEELSRRR